MQCLEVFQFIPGISDITPNSRGFILKTITLVTTTGQNVKASLIN